MSDFNIESGDSKLESGDSKKCIAIGCSNDRSNDDTLCELHNKKHGKTVDILKKHYPKNISAVMKYIKNIISKNKSEKLQYYTWSTENHNPAAIIKAYNIYDVIYKLYKNDKKLAPDLEYNDDDSIHELVDTALWVYRMNLDVDVYLDFYTPFDVETDSSRNYDVVKKYKKASKKIANSKYDPNKLDIENFYEYCVKIILKAYEWGHNQEFYSVEKVSKKEAHAELESMPKYSKIIE